MSNYTFSGFPAFLEAAAARLGRPEAAGPARRQGALAALANLCAQVVGAERGRAPEILAKAAEFRDQLHVAHLAADLMLLDAYDGLGLPRPSLPEGRGEPAAEPSRRDRRAGRAAEPQRPE